MNNKLLNQADSFVKKIRPFNNAINKLTKVLLSSTTAEAASCGHCLHDIQAGNVNGSFFAQTWACGTNINCGPNQQFVYIWYTYYGALVCNDCACIPCGAV